MLCRLLVADGWNVVGTTRKVERAKALEAVGVEPAVVDVFDADALRQAVLAAQPTAVIHQLTDLPQQLNADNLEPALLRNARLREVGTRNLIDACVSARVGHVIAQSIAFAYAPGPQPLTEDAPLNVNASDPVAARTARAVKMLEDLVLRGPFRGVSRPSLRQILWSRYVGILTTGGRRRACGSGGRRGAPGAPARRCGHLQCGGAGWCGLRREGRWSVRLERNVQGTCCRLTSEDTSVIEQILTIVSVTALVMVTPGPDMILVLRNTFVGGRNAGLRTSLGILSGNLVHISYCMLGIGLIISQSIVVFSALKYAGAAYLVYLGVMSFRAGARRLDTDDIGGHWVDRNWFLQGVVNNLLNPKGALFYLGVFTLVITPETSASAMLVLVLSMVAVSASFWVLFVHTLDRTIIRSFIERSQQTMSRIAGALLILFGIRLASMSR